MEKNKTQIQTKITDYFPKIKVYGYNSKTNEWHCLVCGISMGCDNPRQLCEKTWCPSMIKY
jgi:hypothetical protein